ncbi:MAG: hypothetical protein QOH86_723 [Sphingomonadales bacterium]|nr:hypothetical protein [Sphingomonadales bacterium]
MIDNVSVGVRSLEDAASFYDAVLGTLGYTRLAARAGAIGFGTLSRVLDESAGRDAVASGRRAATMSACGRRAPNAWMLSTAQRSRPAARTTALRGRVIIRRHAPTRPLSGDRDGNRIEAVTFPDEHSA